MSSELPAENEAWMHKGFCADSPYADLWFPTEGVESAAYCESLCGGCPVRVACLRYAIDHPELEGIWGGLSARQRRLIRRDRNASCGTYGGYLKHRKADEEACDECKAANAHRSRLKRQKRSANAA